MRLYRYDDRTYWHILDDPRGADYGLGSALSLWAFHVGGQPDEWFIGAPVIGKNDDSDLYEYEEGPTLGGPYTFEDGQLRVMEIVAILERGAA